MAADQISQEIQRLNISQDDNILEQQLRHQSEHSDEEAKRHLNLFATGDHPDVESEQDVSNHPLEILAAPLFSSKVKQAINPTKNMADSVFPMYGLLGLRSAAPQEAGSASRDSYHPDNLVYANMQEPWSAFICGQQGAGKSYTLSCLLENALISDRTMGPNPHPMSGVVFHYDKFTSSHTSQVCEAAYLCSQGIKVQVLVSPSNLRAMRHLYGNLPGLPKGSPKPEVIPFLFDKTQLNVANMKTLMGFDNDDKNPPLYLAVVNKILKHLSIKSGTPSGVNYGDMKIRIATENLTPSQMSFLDMRFSLIEWFLSEFVDRSIKKHAKPINYDPGTLLIVDLSCPFVTESDACSLFSIFLQIFLGKRVNHGLIIALDEAHKFLTETPAAKAFSEDLIQVIRQQRHLATRVLIATQEPTISPKLLDLCNVAIVHQFNSPNWYETLKKHLAALAPHKEGRESGEGVFKTIVRLRRGEALVFCPKAYLDVAVDGSRIEYRPLQDGYARVKIRPRITADGGRSIVASDAKLEEEDMV